MYWLRWLCGHKRNSRLLFLQLFWLLEKLLLFSFWYSLIFITLTDVHLEKVASKSLKNRFRFSERFLCWWEKVNNVTLYDCYCELWPELSQKSFLCCYNNNKMFEAMEIPFTLCPVRFDRGLSLDSLLQLVVVVFDCLSPDVGEESRAPQVVESPPRLHSQSFKEKESVYVSTYLSLCFV